MNHKDVFVGSFKEMLFGIIVVEITKLQNPRGNNNCNN